MIRKDKMRLKRKIDQILEDWKAAPERMPLIIKGARQVGKTDAVRYFAQNNYQSVIEINFTLQPQYRRIFEGGFEVDKILQNISLIDPELEFVPGDTLLFFDELQDCPSAATSLKAFREDGRFDVICSGSMMGINYAEIESNSVGNKEDIELHSLDFEEFLWAKGYTPEQIDDLRRHMREVEPFTELELRTMFEHFADYMVVGGMPAIVKTFIEQKNFSGTLKMQRQILLDYEEDITKYAAGLDQTRVLNVYRKIPVFLGQENRKFQISKVEHGARNREYVGVIDWLKNAGIVNVCYCLNRPELPLKGNSDQNNFRLYFGDTGLLVASLDDEAQEDLRNNRNFNAYKGAIYENVVADSFVKQGLPLYFYRNEKGTVEMDFLVRNAKILIPIEVKANDGATASLNNLINKCSDVGYGIKLCRKNIGYNGRFYTMPYFLSFLVKEFVAI